MSEGSYLAGRMLLAMPGMGDPRFERAVIAMCIHDAQSALGIGIGHAREDISFHGLLDHLGIEPGRSSDCVVHHGGPVEPGRGFILHSQDWEGEETIKVGVLWSLSASVEILEAITRGKGPAHWLIALGYAGWGPGQLDGEMHHHGWYPAEGRSEILFETGAQDRWTQAWKAEGIDPALLVSMTGSA
jgi:putative transcriptional regulator